MKKSEFDLREYGYETVLKETKGMLARRMRRIEDEVIQDLKIQEWTKDSAKFLALTESYKIYKIEVVYENSDQWDGALKISNSIRLEGMLEMKNLRDNFREILKLSIKECDEAMIKFFEDAPCCEKEDEKLEKDKEQKVRDDLVKKGF